MRSCRIQKLAKNFRNINRDTTINNTKNKHSILVIKSDGQIGLVPKLDFNYVCAAHAFSHRVRSCALRHTFLKKNI